MELETLMEEGAGPGPGGREGDAPSADGDDGGTRAPQANGDKAQRDTDDKQQTHSTAAAMKPSPGAVRPASSLNLYLAASTGQSECISFWFLYYIISFFFFFA